jgi:lipoprotein-releasing system permease protein
MKLYKMLNTENIAVYLIFTLVIVVALFNLIGIDYDDSRQKRKSENTFNLGTEIKDFEKYFASRNFTECV